MLGALAVLGYYHFGSLAIHGTEILRWALFWAGFFLMVGLYEEFAFRGYVQFTLTQAVAILAGGDFSVDAVRRGATASNPGETWPGVAGRRIDRAFLVLHAAAHRHVVVCRGHARELRFWRDVFSIPCRTAATLFPGHLSNATLAGPTWLSGGTAGPEASIFDFLMLIAFFFIFHRLFPARPIDTALPAHAKAGSATDQLAPRKPILSGQDLKQRPAGFPGSSLAAEFPCNAVERRAMRMANRDRLALFLRRRATPAAVACGPRTPPRHRRETEHCERLRARPPGALRHTPPLPRSCGYRCKRACDRAEPASARSSTPASAVDCDPW